MPVEPHELARAEPVYETLEGWSEDLRGVRDIAELPVGARRYLDRLSGLAGVKLVLVSVGPARAETIVLEQPFR